MIISKTEEILTILADKYCPTEGLIRADLVGSLTPQNHRALRWRTAVTHTLRVLTELRFIETTQYNYKILPRGRDWLKQENQ